MTDVLLAFGLLVVLYLPVVLIAVLWDGTIYTSETTETHYEGPWR